MAVVQVLAFGFKVADEAVFLGCRQVPFVSHAFESARVGKKGKFRGLPKSEGGEHELQLSDRPELGYEPIRIQWEFTYVATAASFCFSSRHFLT